MCLTLILFSYIIFVIILYYIGSVLNSVLLSYFIYPQYYVGIPTLGCLNGFFPLIFSKSLRYFSRV